MSRDLDEFLPYPVEQHKARVICGDPVAEAWEWISGYTDNLNDMIRGSGGEDDDDCYHEKLTIGELMETADSHQKGEGTWGEYICRGGAFEGVGVDPIFWKKYAIVRGLEDDEVEANGFFSCSC